MTGIFQIFDRYKSKALGRNDRRKSNSGEPEVKIIPPYHLAEEDGVPKKAVPDPSSDRRTSDSSRDSRRPSSADVADVVVKTLASPKESQTTTSTVQKPHSARPSIDSPKPGFSGHKSSSSPLDSTHKDPASQKDTENFSSDAATPKPTTVPSRSSVDHRPGRDAHKLPPRSKSKDRSNGKEVSVHLEDVRDISRAILQMREAANKSPFDGREARKHAPQPVVTSRKEGHYVQRYNSSGDEHESDGKYHKDARRYLSSGDDKDGHHRHGHLGAGEARRYSSAAENFGEQSYDDEKDHHRPQFPFEGKDFVRTWPHSNEARKLQSSSHTVREIARYMSSGDEMERRSNMSSGDERGAVYRFRNHRHQRGSNDQESNRSHWPVDSSRGGQKHHDAFDALREDSSGDEPARPYNPPTARRRHHHQTGGDERGGHRHYALKGERSEGRRHVVAYDAGRDAQGLQSSGDERIMGHHHQRLIPHRRHSSIYYAGYKHYQSAAELNEHQRYQSGGEDPVLGYRHQSASASKASRPSTSGFEGRRYQSSGDERGGHRVVTSRRRHEPPLEACNSWRNESSDDDREAVFPQHHRVRTEDARRTSSATEAAHRRYSVGNDDVHRYSSSNGDHRRQDRSRSSVRDGSKYEPAVVSGEQRHHHIRSNEGHGDWVYEEAPVAPSLPIPAGAKEAGRRRHTSVESKGDHRRWGSNSSVTSNRESVKPHGEPGASKSSSGYSRDLPPRSSGSRPTVSPRNLIDICDLARLNVQVRDSSSSQPPALRDRYRVAEPKPSMAAADAPQLSAESLTGSYDFREMLRAIDFKDAQWASEKTRNSIDGRDPPRTSNVSRVSVDSRQYQSSTPRLSVDGREHLRASSLHSSRASSVDAQVQMRTNSMDSSSTSGEFKRRGPSVVARLMGLAELPEKNVPPGSDRQQAKSLQRLLSSTPPAESSSSPPGKSQLHLSEVAQQMKQVAARLHQDSQLRQKSQHLQESRPKRKTKSKPRTQSRSRSPPPAPVTMQEKDHSRVTLSNQAHQGYGIFGRHVDPGSPLPRQPLSPKHHMMEGMPNVLKKRSSQDQHPISGDLDQRLHQLRIKNSIQEHRTLKQILEAMHLKGLLHPPQQKKPTKSPRAERNEGSLKEEAERPLRDFESRGASSNAGSFVARANRNEYQEQLSFEDLIRMEHDEEQEEEEEAPAVDVVDHSGEASIVVMKPVNYHNAVPPAATKEGDVGSDNGFEREKTEIGHRRRTSGRRSSSSSGRASRSQSLEPPDQSSADKVQVEDLSFANVMLSWRERIAADAAKKATVDIAEVKPQSRSKSSASKHRSHDATPSKHRAASPRVQGSLESEHVLSDTAQENADHDEDRFKVVERSKSDLQLSAKTAEALAAVELSLDRIPAQVAVLRSKRAASKASRSKEKLRASHAADVLSNSTAMPSSDGNLETSADQVAKNSNHSDLKAEDESAAALNLASEDNSRIKPKKRKMVDPGVAVVVEEVAQQHPQEDTPEFVDVQGVSSEEEGGLPLVAELAPLHCTSVDALREAEEPEDAKMEDAFDDSLEAHTPEGFSSGRDKCFSEEGGFSIPGADHPSPVSVLDSPIFQEGFHLEELSTSPDSVKLILLRHDEDASDTPLEQQEPCEPEPEAPAPRSRASKDTPSDPLKDIYTKVARSIELNESKEQLYRSQPSPVELRIPFAATSPDSTGDPSQGKLYVQGILTESGLTAAASPLPNDAAEIMEFDVFTRKEEELQTAELERIDRGELEKTEEKRYKESLDRRLIFDCMNEILERKMSPFMNPQPWGAPVVRKQPCGQRLVDEVWGELKDMHWPTSVAYDALYAVLQKDFMRKGFQWLDFSVEVGEVGCELEWLILQELVEEVVLDVRNMKPESAGNLELCQHEAASAACCSPRVISESSDDSELRRRELLDKTRRDLLAWHVQYQQL